MKQLGNLAIVCAKRHDVLFQILDGKATVYICHDGCKAELTADWHDNARIMEIILDLNHGKFAAKTIGKAR